MRKLEVRLDWGDQQVVVGALAEQDRRVYFEYDRAFLQALLRGARGIRRETEAG